MRYYKSACGFDDTRVHTDYSVIASEFCDFLSEVLTYRLINLFDKKKLLNERTHKEIMLILSQAKKVNVVPEGWQLVRINAADIQILQDLELLPKPQEAGEQKPKRKRGRPKKQKNIV